MNELEAIDRFVEEIGRVRDVAALFQVVERQIKSLGFEWYTYQLPAGLAGARSVFYRGNYPAAWTLCYSEINHEADDVILHRLATTVVPFAWSDIIHNPKLTATQRRVLDKASEFDLLAGAAVSVRGPGAARGQFIVGTSMRPSEFARLFAKRRFQFHLIAAYTHERATELIGAQEPQLRVRLTPRETEVLRWMARGKTNGDIAGRLTVSETTIKEHVANICRKFGVKTKVHATSLALWHGHITL